MTVIMERTNKVVQNHVTKSDPSPCLTIMQALQLELEKYKEDLAALGAEADEMRSKLKQVEKLEKTKKGHSAMTAELKKMKAEIVVDVSLHLGEYVTQTETLLSRNCSKRESRENKHSQPASPVTRNAHDSSRK